MLVSVENFILYFGITFGLILSSTRKPYHEIYQNQHFKRINTFYWSHLLFFPKDTTNRVSF